MSEEVFLLLAGAVMIILAALYIKWETDNQEKRDQERVMSWTPGECRRIVITQLKISGYKIVEAKDATEDTKKITKMYSCGVTREIEPVYYEEYK